VAVLGLVIFGLLGLSLRNIPFKSGLFNGWVSHSSKNSYRSKYLTFRGFVSCPIKIEEPRQMTFTYTLNAEKGRLDLILKHPNHTEHELVSVEENAIEGSTVVQFPVSGKYRLRIVGTKTRGNFEVEWS
jgi:hypothetical protein